MRTQNPVSRISLLIIYDCLQKLIQGNLSKREGIGNQPRYSHKHWFHYKIPTNLDTYLKMHCLVHHSGTLDELYLVLFADIKRSSFASSFGLHKYEMLFPRFQFKAGLEDARYSVFIFFMNFIILRSAESWHTQIWAVMRP